MRHVLGQDHVQLPRDLFTLRRVFHRRHGLEQTVKLRVLVARVVLAGGWQVFAVVEEKEVFRVGVVRPPAAAGRNLEAALVHLFHEPRKRVLDHFDLDADGLELALLKLGHEPLVGAPPVGVEGQLQGFAAGIPPPGVACLHHQGLRLLQIEGVRIPELLLVAGDSGIGTLLKNTSRYPCALNAAESAWRSFLLGPNTGSSMLMLMK